MPRRVQLEILFQTIYFHRKKQLLNVCRMSNAARWLPPNVRANALEETRRRKDASEILHGRSSAWQAFYGRSRSFCYSRGLYCFTSYGFSLGLLSRCPEHLKRSSSLGALGRAGRCTGARLFVVQRKRPAAVGARKGNKGGRRRTRRGPRFFIFEQAGNACLYGAPQRVGNHLVLDARE